nr:protein FMP32, mitochondrial-like [Tanacetum cinerariifolium]
VAEFLYGEYNGVGCFVKRVLAKTASGYYFPSLNIQRLCNEQANMVRIHEIRCDGEYYEIAMERCEMNMDEFIRDPKIYEKLKRFSRDLIQGIIHLHDNRVVRSLEAQGVPSKQAQAITSAITEIRNDSLENVADSFVSKVDLEKKVMHQEASLSKLKSQLQSVGI